MNTITLQATLIEKMRSKARFNLPEFWTIKLKTLDNTHGNYISLKTKDEFFRTVMFGDTIELTITVKNKIGTILNCASAKNFSLVRRREV